MHENVVSCFVLFRSKNKNNNKNNNNNNFSTYRIASQACDQKVLAVFEVLMCGMNAFGAQWQGSIIILHCISLKIVVLLQKTWHSSKLWSQTVWYCSILRIIAIRLLQHFFQELLKSKANASYNSFPSVNQHFSPFDM